MTTSLHDQTSRCLSARKESTTTSQANPTPGRARVALCAEIHPKGVLFSPPTLARVIWAHLRIVLLLCGHCLDNDGSWVLLHVDKTASRGNHRHRGHLKWREGFNDEWCVSACSGEEETWGNADAEDGNRETATATGIGVLMARADGLWLAASDGARKGRKESHAGRTER